MSDPYDNADRVVDLSKARAARDAQNAAQEVVAGEVLDFTDDLAGQPDPARPGAELVTAAESSLVDAAVHAAADVVKAARRDRPRHPILPSWVTDPATAKAAVQWAVGYYAHCTAFHTVRLPLYWGQLAARSPRGTGRVLAAVARWAVEAEHREVRHNVAKAADPHTYLRLKEQRRKETGGRAAIVAGGLLAVAILLAVLTAAPLATRVAAFVAITAVLGLVGRGEGTRITGRSVNAAEVPRLTADLIISALSTLGLGSINAAMRQHGDRAVGFPGPITRDGPGWRADIDLPGGATAGEVIDRRSKLASGLRRPLGCVWPEAAPEVHEGRLVMWIGDKPLSASKPTVWPLAKAGKVNLFEPFVIGTDQRGRPIHITLMFVAMLIGAVPRQGKTFTLRLILLAAALDVRVELHIYDLKGGADMLPLQPVAHSFRVGDDPEDIEYLLRDLERLHAEMKRRYRLFRTLPEEVCPEGKVTDELASRRDLGLHPIVLAMDECGLAFDHKTHGAKITDICVDLVKRGPAAGIILIPATQRIDAASVPTGISANAVLRFALKVMDHTANDMILGSGMYKAGVRATMFAPSDKGIGLLVGEGDEPALVRTAYIDSPEAKVIALRARAARKAADRLTGLAAGEEEPDQAHETVIDHLLAVWPRDEHGNPATAAWCADLAESLQGAYPATYEGWTGAQVTSAVAPHGLTANQVKRVIDGRQTNRRGLSHDALTRAAADLVDEAPNTGDSGNTGTDPASGTSSETDSNGGSN